MERLDSYGRTAGIAGSVIALAIWAGINVQVGETDVLISTSLFILLPALLALFSTMIRHMKLLLVASFWSLPMTLYFTLAANHLFKLAIAAPVLCFIAAFVLLAAARRSA